jgi:hypothetical protein
MKIFKSKNEAFFNGGMVEWGDGSKEAYMKTHPSAARQLGNKQGEVVECDKNEAFYIDGKGVLKHG